MSSTDTHLIPILEPHVLYLTLKPPVYGRKKIPIASWVTVPMVYRLPIDTNHEPQADE